MHPTQTPSLRSTPCNSPSLQEQYSVGRGRQRVDVGSRAQIYNLLRKFTEESVGRAVLFATSDPEEAISIADRIIVLVNGQVKHVVGPSIGEAELMSLAQSVEVSHGVGH